LPRPVGKRHRTELNHARGAQHPPRQPAVDLAARVPGNEGGKRAADHGFPLAARKLEKGGVRLGDGAGEIEHGEPHRRLRQHLARPRPSLPGGDGLSGLQHRRAQRARSFSRMT
jgi:hypothetical protein